MRVPGHQRKSYAWRWTAALAGLAVLSVALVMALVVAPPERVQAVSYSVTTAADPGITPACPATTGHPCTLRQAIINANLAGGANTITFNISGGGTIHLAGNLDPITDDNLTITGQASVTVEASGALNGLEFNADNVRVSNFKLDGSGSTGAGLLFDANAGGATITNVTVGDFGHGVLFTNNNDTNTFSGCTIKDNGVGMDLANNSDGNAITNTTVQDSTSHGIVIAGAASDGNTITGATIKNNGGDGIQLGAGHDNSVHTSTVSSNNKGVNATGAVRLVVDSSTIQTSNLDGVVLSGGHDNTVSADTIKNNGDHGVDLNGEAGSVVENSTLSGNAGALVGPDKGQILITGGGTGTIRILSNSIVAGSDGIVVAASVLASANIQIGTALAYCNLFSGSLTQASPPVGAADDWYLENDSADNIHASYNDWNGATGAAINGVVCAGNTNTICGAGTADTSSALTSCAAIATVTPTVTITPTPGTPTVTVTPIPTSTSTPIGGVTATPTTGAMESVTLVGGVCNPVANTYPDGTAITTIANAVSPSGILISIWKFDTGTSMWLGYSPQFPQASDLTGDKVKRLDAIFICVSSAGTWSRPLI